MVGAVECHASREIPALERVSPCCGDTHRGNTVGSRSPGPRWPGLAGRECSAEPEHHLGSTDSNDVTVAEKMTVQHPLTVDQGAVGRTEIIHRKSIGQFDDDR